MARSPTGEEARERLAAIAPLLHGERTVAAVRARAAACSRHPSTLYGWLRTYEATGDARALAPSRSDGGRGRGRLAPPVERIVALAVTEAVASAHAICAAEVARTIAQRCRASGCKPPHPNTIRARLAAASGLQNPARAADGIVFVAAAVSTDALDRRVTERGTQPTATATIVRDMTVASGVRRGFWNASRALIAPEYVRAGFRKPSPAEPTEPGLVVCAALAALVTWLVGR